MRFTDRRWISLLAAFLIPGLAAVALGAWGRLGEDHIRATFEGRTFWSSLLEYHRSQAPELRGLEYYLSRVDGGRSAIVAAAVFGFVGVVVLLWRRQLVAALVGFFRETDSPRNLAAFRIVVFGALLASTWAEADVVLRFAELPLILRVDPVGPFWFLPELIVSPWIATAGLVLLATVCVAGLLGLYARSSALIAFVLLVSLFAIPNSYGKVNHLHHHLAWFLLLLSASPCADAWSVRAPAQVPERSRIYALPIRFAWLLMAVLYFFPGFWKLTISAPGWLWGDSLKWLILNKVATLDGWAPWLHVDSTPWLYRPFAWMTFAFELGFIALLLRRKTRTLVALVGLGFHFGSFATMGIWFWPLQLCYAVFVDWDALWRRFRGQPSTGIAAAPQRATTLVVVVGIALVMLNSFYGLRRTRDGWPFACYPDFASPIIRPTVTELHAQVFEPSSGWIEVPASPASRQLRPERWQGLTYAVMMTSDPALRTLRLQALWRLWSDLADVQGSVRLYRETRSTLSESAGHPPLESELLIDVPG